MKYAYEDLSDEQFEDLIVLLCQKLLGVAVQKFSTGPDGGRDAKFVGTAQLFPSTAAPWVGVTVIQGKHTNGYNRNFAETDFYSGSTDKTILGKELLRIKKLRAGKKLDHYMLFANRRLAANAEDKIVQYIAAATGVPASSLYLCGIEQLELLLKSYPEVAALANLDLVDSPLLVSPDELSEIVQAFAQHKPDATAEGDTPPAPRISYENKNATNGMNPDYARDLRRLYLKDAATIRRFFAAPENADLLRFYETATDEFRLKIISKRKQHQPLDAVLEYLVDLLFARDPILRQHKRLTRALLFYMYWNCDIGDNGDAQTDEALAS